MAKSVSSPESLLASVPTELSHGLFAKARTISLTADQIVDEGKSLMLPVSVNDLTCEMPHAFTCGVQTTSSLTRNG
jgi:hypothetical protein